MQHVLLVYQQLIPSAILCGHAQLEYLASAGKIEYEHCCSHQVTAEMISRSDTVVIIRGALDFDLLTAKTAKRAGKRVVYVLDDDLFNVPGHIESSRFYGSMVTKSIMRRIMSCCDCLASPSEKLIEKYGETFPETALIEEPALPHQQKNFEVKDKVNIVFAGSLDRTSDIEAVLSDALRRIKSEYGDAVNITFFGAKPQIVGELGLDYIGYCMDYYDYMDTMSGRQFDIGLAPMVSNEFSECKHYNKYIEYSSYAIAGIYSNVYPYTRAVRNMENGILCSNSSEDWHYAIKNLIDNPELRSKLRACCRAEAETVYSVKTVSENYLSVLGNSATERTGVSRFRFRVERKLYRLSVFFARCVWFIRRKLRRN